MFLQSPHRSNPVGPVNLNPWAWLLQVLYGFYTVPKDRDSPIDVVINPAGDEIRSIRR